MAIRIQPLEIEVPGDCDGSLAAGGLTRGQREEYNQTTYCQRAINPIPHMITK